MFKHNWVEAIIVGGWVNKVVIPSWIDMVISSFKDGFIYIYSSMFSPAKESLHSVTKFGEFPNIFAWFSHICWDFPAAIAMTVQRWVVDPSLTMSCRRSSVAWCHYLVCFGRGCKWYINQSNNGDFDQEKLGLKIHHLAVKIEVWKLNNKTCGLNNQTLGFHLDDPLVF